VENKKNRIEYLDGHRGLAILLVALYHAYARWPAFVPYQAQFAEVALFKYGWLGVELFFLISGFVILMTLEKCSTAGEFLYRRWLRLFPAMLVCTVIIFLTSDYFSERPGGIPPWESVLPGLSFIEPDWWSALIGRPIAVLEGSFWSLYAEFKFYVFAALIYYWRGRNALIGSLTFVFLVSTAARVAQDVLGLTDFAWLYSLSSVLSFRYFGWFAAGAAFYVFSQNKSRQWLLISLIAVLVCAISESALDLPRFFAAMGVATLFAASVLFQPVQQLLSNRFIQFFGVISYPFYLIHEGMMIAIITKLGRTFGDIPPILLPLPALLIVAGFAFLICKYAEPAAKSALMMALRKKPVLLGVPN
jgi:peptidoglycan/LPS O-acetylase OafA/YrhL